MKLWWKLLTFALMVPVVFGLYLVGLVVSFVVPMGDGLRNICAFLFVVGYVMVIWAVGDWQDRAYRRECRWRWISKGAEAVDLLDEHHAGVEPEEAAEATLVAVGLIPKRSQT